VFTAILLIAVGSFIIVKTFTPENLNTITSGKIYETIKRPATVEKVTVLPFKGIRIKNIKILDTSNELGKNLLSAGEMILSYEFLPLFKKKVVINQITLDNPEITLIKNKNGTWNFEGLMPEKKDGQSRISEMNLHFSMKKVKIKNAIVTVINMPKDRKDVFYNVDIELSDVEKDKNFPYRISMVSKNEIAKKPVSFEISAGGFVNFAGFDWERAKVYDTSAKIYFLSRPIHLTLGMSNFASPVFSISAQVPSIIYKDLSLFIKKPVSINFPQSSWKIKGSFKRKHRTFER
jgi:uncharacterized protein involved in outer membrane biogenesis